MWGEGGSQEKKEAKEEKENLISAKKKKKKDKRGCRRENVKETSAFDERQLKKGVEGTLGGYC